MNDIIKELELRLESQPTDYHLINKLAIRHLMNENDYNSLNKADELFLRAYQLETTTKTATNYAYQLIMSDDEYQKGVDVLKPIVDIKPNLYLPYNLLGYAYMKLEEYTMAITNFNIAILKSNSKVVEILINIGYCYCEIREYNIAIEYFNKAINLGDTNNEAKFNKAICLINLSNTSSLDELINQIKSSDSYKDQWPDISNHSISSLYYSVGRYKDAYNNLSENLNFGLLSFSEFSFLLLKYDKKKFDDCLDEAVKINREWLKETFDPNDEDYKDYSKLELTQEREEIEKEYNDLLNLESKFNNNFPLLDINTELLHTACGCCLYDCELHNNPFDDK